MKYRADNTLHDFEFHDAEWHFVSYDSESLIVDAKHLNIHKNTAQNPANCDMELQLARITFYGCEIITFEPGVPWITDASGKSCPAEPLITYTGHAAREMLLHELNCTTCIFAFSKSDCERWRMAGCGDEPYFEAQISFDAVTIEWDEFRRPAWYVLREQGIHA
ncbi:MAG: hypothetical protein IKB78_04365 [Clostridia bacterium]|nr:hypothetical protein [Clostridia bacterium]